MYWHQRAWLVVAALFSLPLNAATPLSGLYLRAEGGLSHTPNNVDLTNTFSDADYRYGFDAGGELGFKRGPWRYGLEGIYVRNKVKRFDYASVRQLTVSGRSKSYASIVSIYYDFEDRRDGLAPYVGLGAGLSWVKLQFNSSAPSDVSMQRRAWLMTYAAQAGLNYNFEEDMSAAIGYQFLRTKRSARYNKPYQAHLVNFSVTYRFDS